MYLFVAALVGKWHKCFYVSQGSVATYVRYGGKHDKGFIANLLLAKFKSERILKIGQRIRHARM